MTDDFLALLTEAARANDRARLFAVWNEYHGRCPFCQKYGHGTVGPCITVAHHPTLCTCATPLRPSALDECQRCYRPVWRLMAERYGWWVIDE